MAAPTTSLGQSDDPVVAAIIDAYERFHPELVRRCQRVAGDRATAEEAAQEAFARALERRPAVDGDHPLEAWLTTVATRAAIDHVRKRARAPHEPLDGVEVLPRLASEDTGDVVTRRDARRRLDAALGALPHHHRRALVLFGVEGLSYSEIAADQGTSLGAIKMTIHRARERLKASVHINDFHGAVPAGVGGGTDEGRGVVRGLARQLRQAAEAAARWPLEAPSQVADLVARAGAAVAVGAVALVPLVSGPATPPSSPEPAVAATPAEPPPEAARPTVTDPQPPGQDPARPPTGTRPPVRPDPDPVDPDRCRTAPNDCQKTCGQNCERQDQRRIVIDPDDYLPGDEFGENRPTALIRDDLGSLLVEPELMRDRPDLPPIVIPLPGTPAPPALVPTAPAPAPPSDPVPTGLVAPPVPALPTP